MRRILFVVAPNVHLLDLSGPAQVFSTAGNHGAAYTVSFVGDEAVTRSHQGLDLVTPTSWPKLSARDTVVIAGWQTNGDVECALSRSCLDATTAHHRRGGRIVGVCAGAIALAQAGLLDGRRATTHHDLQNRLAMRYPRVEVVPDVLFVSDGRVHTSAGIASGIDLALHLVALDHGPQIAAQTASELVVAAQRSGGAPQAGALLRHRGHLSGLVHQAQNIIDDRFNEPLPLVSLAGELSVSPRTLTRAFFSATGMTPLRYQKQLRAERAQGLIDLGWTREQAAQEVGFAGARMLRRRCGEVATTRTSDGVPARASPATVDGTMLRAVVTPASVWSNSSS